MKNARLAPVVADAGRCSLRYTTYAVRYRYTAIRAYGTATTAHHTRYNNNAYRHFSKSV